jgi:tRNA/rRNA methyltransferase
MIRDAKAVNAPAKRKVAPAREIERFTRDLYEVLRTSGYIKPRAASAEEKLRRLVRRLNLDARDTAVLLGMMRQIAWKMGDKK